MTPRPRALFHALTRPSLLAATAVATTVATTAACIGSIGRPPPTDRVVFPSGLAMSPDGTRLAVVSSNFDFAFDHGAVLLANLPDIESQLVGPDAVVAAPWIGAAFVPTFGDRPVFSADGAHLLLTTRDGNLLHELIVDGNAVSCDSEGLCDQSPHALGLAQNDPFDVTIVEESEDAIRAFVTFQSGREGNFVTVTPSQTGADRLRLEAGAVNFGEAAFGVRAVVLRPATETRAARLFATIERRTNTVAVGAELVAFDLPRPGRAADVVPTVIDLEPAVGARSIRDVVVVDDGLGGDALIVALRIPDAIARFSIDARGAPTLTAIADTCQTPISLAVARVPVGDGVVEQVLVTCHDSQAVQALDPLTLQATDAVRFFGRGPYDIVVSPDGTKAFVSFMFDNSVGAFSLVGAGAEGPHARLSPIGRLGTPLPRPEDGRE